MLIGLDPLLSPDLLWVLAAMGHGDDLALVDANHPAETIARATASGRLVRLPGVRIERAARAILSVLPGMYDCPPKPGFTDITSTRSTYGRISAIVSMDVAGFSVTPGFTPSSRICCTVRCRCGLVSTCTVR